MRVVMLGPHLHVMGGISVVAETLLSAQAMRGVDVRYISTTVNGSSRAKARELATAQAAFLADLARRGPPDLYHFHVAADSSFYRKLWFFTAALRTRRPIVIQFHGALVLQFYESGPVHAAAMRWMCTRAAGIYALYPGFGEAVSGWTNGKARIRHLLNPVVLSELTPPPGHTPPARPTVLFMGIIGDRKGAFDLVHAIPEVLKAVPDAHFRFGGNGQVDRLKTLAEELGVADHVEALGWVRGEDKRRVFHEASVYCLPTYNEVLPVSVLEAMAARLPVLSTPIAGIPEAVVDGETGYLVQPGDRAAIASRLIDLLTDPQRRAAMGQAGRARAEARFDHEVVAQRLIDLWSQTIREHAAEEGPTRSPPAPPG